MSDGPAVLRPLGFLEAWIDGLTAFAPCSLHVVAVVELGGVAEPSRLRRAFEVLHHRHPLLGARIAGGVFVGDVDFGAVPFTVEPLDGRDPLALAEGELAVPLARGGPLWRA